MRAAVMTLLAAGAALAVGGCHKNPQQQDQNIVIENGIDANADIEALPPDESSATPSNELINGDDNPEVNDLNNNST